MEAPTAGRRGNTREPWSGWNEENQYITFWKRKYIENKKEEKPMIKQIAWNTFKNTGDINTFLELMEVQNIEKNMISGEKNNNIIGTR